MKLLVITLLLLAVSYGSTVGKLLPGDLDGNQNYISHNVYYQNRMPSMQDNQKLEHYRSEPPCPDAEDIAPCMCTTNGETDDIDLDCSTVESEDQLRQIFQSYFPLKNLRKFYIVLNKNLKKLESYVFNDISFEEIIVYNNELEEIEMHALSSCYDTAIDVNFDGNKIKTFPFDDLLQFSQLKRFRLSSNFLENLPADAFHYLTTLEGLFMADSTTNIIGTFENLPNLNIIGLESNNLTIISSKFLKTGSDNISQINLQANNLSSVEPDAFDIVEGLNIDMTFNSLSTLEESTWHPLLEAGVFIFAGQNPLVCGCDIAWLYDEDQLLKKVSEDTTCIDGEYLHHLDPSIFDDC